jgi:hypothetical protein
MSKVELNIGFEHQKQFKQKCLNIVQTIDPRLKVIQGFGGGENGPMITGNFKIQEDQHSKLFIILEEHEIASFPIDEIFTDQEVRGKIIAGLQKHNAKNSIQL